jgi:hypothetical protein
MNTVTADHPLAAEGMKSRETGMGDRTEVMA